MGFRFRSPFFEFGQDLIGLAVGLRSEFLAELPVAAEKIVDYLLAAPVHIPDEDPEVAGLRFMVIESRHHALEPLLVPLECLLMAVEGLLMAVEGGHQALESQGVTLGSDTAESQLFLAALRYLRQFPSPHATILTKTPAPVARQMDQFRNPLASS
jgi:hypothetical protein